MSNCSIALQILPMDADQETVISVVDAVIDYLKSKVERLEVGPFETTMEGNFQDLMPILQEAIAIAGKEHSHIFSNVKIAYKPRGQVMTIEDKVTKHR